MHVALFGYTWDFEDAVVFYADKNVFVHTSFVL